MKHTILSKTSTHSPQKINHQGSMGTLDKNSSQNNNHVNSGSLHNDDLNTSAQERHYQRQASRDKTKNGSSQGGSKPRLDQSYPKLQYSNKVLAPFGSKKGIFQTSSGALSLNSQGMLQENGSYQQKNFSFNPIVAGTIQHHILPTNNSSMPTVNTIEHMEPRVHTQTMRLNSGNSSLSRPKTGSATVKFQGYNNMSFGEIRPQTSSQNHRRYQTTHQGQAQSGFTGPVGENISGFDIGFQTKQLRPGPQYQLDKKDAQVSCSSQVQLKRRDSAKNSAASQRDESASFTQTAIKNGYMSKVQFNTAQISSNKKKHRRGFSSRLYQVRENAGDIVILTSKIAANDQLAGKQSANAIEMLSTDETEVRQHVEIIEKTVQERALSRYNQMVQSGKSKDEMFKIAKQINDITFKYRIQNGGGLAQPTYQLKYPQEVRVTKVSGLDITPLTSEKEIGVNFDIFQKHNVQPNPESVRKDFPDVGCGASYKPAPKVISIIHDTKKWKDFVQPPNRYNIFTKQLGTYTSLNSTIQSPVEKDKKLKLKSASSRELELHKKMEEAKQKFFKDETGKQSGSVEQSQDNKVSEDINPARDVHNAGNNRNSRQEQMNKVNQKRHHALSVEDKLMIKQEVEQDDRFMRSAVQSNKLKLLMKERDGKPPSDLQKWGFDNTSMQDKKSFDPLRLKILVMPCQEANPVGRNADYFFLKGFKEMSTEDYAHAMAAYLKGIDIKQDHLLCRFNLGVCLFSLGLYDEASSQYDILVKQGFGERAVVMFNKALCELQCGKYLQGIDSTQKCINVILQKMKKGKTQNSNNAGDKAQSQPQNDRQSESVLSNNEIEMLADMNVIQGLCCMRSQNLKKAGRCFDEAKNYKVQRKSEMYILLQRCLFKMINERIMSNLREQSKTQLTQPVQNVINESSIALIYKQDVKKDEQSQVNARQSNASRTRNNASNQRAASMAKIYLTDIDHDRDFFGIRDPQQETFGVLPQDNAIVIDDKGKRPNLSKFLPRQKKIGLARHRSLPVFDTKNLFQIMLEEGFQAGKVNLQPNNQKAEVTAEQQKPEKQQKIPLIDEMSPPMLMEIMKQIIQQRSDPEQCYHYIDDERTLRLEKVLNIPNSFEVKKGQATEKEKQEKQRRDAIEIQFMKAPTPNSPKKMMPAQRQDDDTSSINSEEENYNLMLEKFFKLEDRLTSGITDEKQKDREAFIEFMTQIQRFNSKLDLSLNYFLSDHHQQNNAANTSSNNSNNSQKKLESEIELGFNEIKSLIVEQANKKPEIEFPRLKLDELNTVVSEMTKENKLDRNVDKIEQYLIKLKAFKNLNPKLRQLVIRRSHFRKVAKNEVIYNQGQEGQYYYYILRGSVTLMAKRQDFGNFELFLRSYYDGDCFGEQPQLFGQQDSTLASDDQLYKLSLRDATCISNEESLVLEVNNAVKHEFYRNDSSNEYERCIYWLRKNPIFKFTEGFYLLQMIFNIQKRTYYLGESLVKSGEVPDGMFIITSGQCKAVLESIGIKQIESGEFSRFQKKPKNFACGVVREQGFSDTNKGGAQEQNITDDNNKEESSNPQLKYRDEALMQKFNSDNSVFNYLKGDEKRSFQSTRIYLDDENKHLGSHIAFKDNIIFSNLVPGDSFATRTLLPNDEIVKRLKPDELDMAKALIASTCFFQKKEEANKKQKPGDKPVFNQNDKTRLLFKAALTNLKTSALSVVADSKEVEVLILRSNILSFLPEHEKDKIYTDIASRVTGGDPDKPSSITEVMNVKGESKKWEHFRVRLVKDIRKSQYMERHKGVYKR